MGFKLPKLNLGKVAKNIGKTVAKAAKDVKNAEVKAVKDTAHEAVRAAKNPIVQGLVLATVATVAAPVAIAGAKKVIDIAKGRGGHRSTMLKPTVKPEAPAQEAPASSGMALAPSNVRPGKFPHHSPTLPAPTVKNRALPAMKPIAPMSDVAGHADRKEAPVKLHLGPDRNATDNATMLNANRKQREEMPDAQDAEQGGGGAGLRMEEGAAAAGGSDWKKWLPLIIGIIILIIIAVAMRKKS